MPRVTRKSLADSPATPSRMSPRASTKASTTSSRTSRSAPAPSPRTSRSRGAKNDDIEEKEAEPVETKTPTRGRQQKPSGDANTPDDTVTEKPQSRARGRAAAKTPETKGRSRSRGKPTESEVAEVEEEAVNTSKGRSRTKTEEKVEETGRTSRSRARGKDTTEDKVSVDKEASAQPNSRSRSSNKDHVEETSPGNSRNRRGAKPEESPMEKEDDSTTGRGRGRSRTKPECKKTPEVEKESPKGRKGGRSQKAPSPSNESVGSSRSSSRSRASKAHSEEVVETAEEPAKAEANDSAKSTGRRRGGNKAAEEASDKVETPTGRRGSRGKKMEASPVTPTKKRRSRGKAEEESKEEEEEAADTSKQMEQGAPEEPAESKPGEELLKAAPGVAEEKPEVEATKPCDEEAMEEDAPEEPSAAIPTQKEISKVVDPVKETTQVDGVAPEIKASVDDSVPSMDTSEESQKDNAVSKTVEEVKTVQEDVKPEIEANGERMETMTTSNVSSGGQGQKRKLDDDSLEESSSKRVCVDNGTEKPKQEAPVETATPVVQQPGIEAISDVSSAEEEPPMTSSQSSAPESSQVSWPMSTSAGTNPAAAPELPKQESSLNKEISTDAVETTPVAATESPVKKPATEEAMQGETSQSLQAEEDLTAGYVVINMEDVPPTDSIAVKEAVTASQNHANQVQNKRPEAMEVEEQNGSITTVKTDAVELAPSPEKEKSGTVIAKPVHFEPSPNIFQRSCVHNPALNKNTVPASHVFTVASYNILAECARKRGDYSYTDEQYLVQNYRHELLWRELKYLDADIVCLQEVNPQYYNTTLQPAMLKSGYQGTFIKRTWDLYDEGEATFFKTSRFALESNKGLSLAELSRKNISESSLSPEVRSAIEEYLNRADVVNICRLRCRQTNKILTIGNIHVVWDQLRSPDVQSIQIASAVKELVSQAGSDSSPHILCGDFNSVPTSVGYQLAQDGYLSDSNIASLQAVENLNLQTGSKALVNHLWGAFQHTSSNLKSAYFSCQGDEPEVTTYTSHMLECVDYLFYGSVGLGIQDVLRVVDRNVVEDTNGLPTKDFPSDHLSLKASFFFK